MASIIASIARPAAALGRSAVSATTSMSSDLFTISPYIPILVFSILFLIRRFTGIAYKFLPNSKGKFSVIYKLVAMITESAVGYSKNHRNAPQTTNLVSLYQAPKTSVNTYQPQ
jgi:hypothetical protein